MTSPGAGFASRAAGHLRDGLRETLGGAKVAGEQALIGIQDHHQADLGKVMTLGEHLRADQNSRLAAMHAVEHGLHGASRGCRVSIQPRQRRVREQSRQGFLDPLGALTHGIRAADRNLPQIAGTGPCAPQ